MIAETREGDNAKKTFHKAKEVADKKPRLVVTDGLQGYKGAFNSEFYDHHLTTKHISNVALESGLNNSIERMHGTFREREKVMRGLKVDDTPIIPHPARPLLAIVFFAFCAKQPNNTVLLLIDIYNFTMNSSP